MLGLFAALGGVGLFLLGMLLLTDGLRGLAGESTQAFLRRFTRSPATGAVAGAAATAVVQSSSATTVAAVGFAGAGLLSFGEALGIVFGANVGTTVTGWMVAIVGFKLDVGAVIPALVFGGALLRILGSRRVAASGLVLAGLGLVFLGIETLQHGMTGLAGIVTPERFPSDTSAGRLQLVGIGVVITLVTQSSSAGVATALTALSTDSISFGQAASMVIGMDVGTTVSAALATVGATLPGRRTGWAHVIYNLFTACGALVLLPLYVATLGTLMPGVIGRQPELALVGFHTLFNTAGLIAVLPVAKPFARLVERLVTQAPAPFTHLLDRSLLREPGLALRAVAPTLDQLAGRTLGILSELLEGRSQHAERLESLGLIELALAEVQDYLRRVERVEPSAVVEARFVAALHVVDQLRRLLYRLGQPERIAVVRSDPQLQERAAAVVGSLPGVTLSGPGDEARIAATAEELANARPAFRERILRWVTRDVISLDAALDRLDAYRWLERVTHHGWRATHHLGQLMSEEPTGLALEPPEPE